MKKQILALSLISAFAATAAHAAMTPVTGGEWAESLNFNGAITNTNPIWEFEITNEVTALATDMDISLVLGVGDGTNITWTFDGWDEELIFYGQMDTFAPIVGPGLTPTIYFGVAETEVTGTDENPTLITVEATGDSNQVGEMIIPAKLAGALGFEVSSRTEVRHTISTISSTASVTNRLNAHPDMISLGYDSLTPSNDSSSNLLRYLTATNMTNQIMALGVITDPLTLSFPSGDIPDTWEATLPIKVVIN